MAPVIVSLADAARHHELPRRTLQRWVAEGRLINHGTPRRARLDLVEVEQLHGLRDDTGGRRLPRSA